VNDIAVVGLICVACITTVVVVRRTLVLPMRRVSEAVRAIASGSDRTVRLRGGPFMRRLARAVDELSEQITELRRAAQDESLNLRTILSNMTEGVLIADQGSRIRLANDGLRRIFNLAESPINRTILEVFLNHNLQRAVTSALLEGQPQIREIEQNVREEEGYARRFFHMTASAVTPRGSEAPMAVVVVFNDVTKLKELETVRQEFVANVSHELRTPLAIINGYLETLLDGAIDQRDLAENFLRTMLKHGQRLNLLIEDLLALSKLESHDALMEFDQVCLREMIERVIEQLHPRIENTSASVRLTVEDGLPAIRADSLRLDQLFFNLVDNALKYSGPSPQVEIEASHKPKDCVTVVVRDRGPGIPLQDQPNIFARFYRVHKDRSRDAGGTGLGLSIVKHIAQAHGGRVWVESHPGDGAAFIVELPIKGPGSAQTNELAMDIPGLA
jgi:two-component system phosphate regulon sensor histidine kinase PhoR